MNGRETSWLIRETKCFTTEVVQIKKLECVKVIFADDKVVLAMVIITGKQDSNTSNESSFD